MNRGKQPNNRTGAPSTMKVFELQGLPEASLPYLKSPDTPQSMKRQKITKHFITEPK